MDREQQCGDIAVADDDLWIPADPIEVQIRQQPAAAPAAANWMDRRDRVVAEECVDVVGARLVVPREIPVPLHDVRAELDLESERLERLARNLHVDRLE